MSKNKLFWLIGIISLLFGGLIYVLYRDSTFIGGLFKEFYIIEKLKEILQIYDYVYISYYLPDFLWCLSLCSGLIVILGSNIKNMLLCCVISFLCGTTWEILQLTNIVSGTADIFDILMYLLAVLTAIIIYLLGDRKNEKSN